MSARELRRERPETCLSDLALERSLAGELSALETAATEQHLGSCLACRERCQALSAAPVQIPDALWWRQNAPLRDGRSSERGRGRRREWVVAGVASMAAATAILVLLARPATVGRSPEPTRLKGGGLSLEVYARRPDGRVEAVFEGTALRPGDAIRFVVTVPTPGAGYAAVLGLDGAGHVSIYAPGYAPGAGTHEVPGSVVLDDTPGDERLVALLCETAPTPAALTAAGARALAAAGGDPRRAPPLELPCRQAGLSIRKDVGKDVRR